MSHITYGSICSGISSESVAWGYFGWKPLWFSEINSFCSSLLFKRYPDVPNLGDAFNIRRREDIPTPSLIVAGTPCQTFSVAGTRDGMGDVRGILSLEFVRIVSKLHPTWVVWENVENAIRIDGGKAFGSILGGLAECGYGWAYRIFDLRGFGISQRRRRVFVVGFLGNHRPAVATLFDGTPTRKDRGSIKKVQSTNLAGTKTLISSWCGDETPKRSLNSMPTLRSSMGGEGFGVFTEYGPRRLSISEYESLQGFPVGYTAIPYGNSRIASDSVRRHAIGNSFPPPILFWIGQRINYIHGRISNASTQGTEILQGRSV